MKKQRLFAILAAVLFVQWLVWTPSNALGENNHTKTLIVAGDENYPPFEFVSDEDGAYRGLNVDVMQAIELETGVEIKLVPMPWNDAKRALLEGRVDAIQGMVRTDGRELFYDFSDAYHISAQVIFVRSETNDIASVADLKGRTVGLQRGDVNEEMMSSFNGIRLAFFSDQKQALEALLNGETDAVLGNKATGIYHLQRLKRIQEIKIVGETISINEYGVAVKNGNQEVLDIFNQGIRGIKDKGTLKKINYKWFGESIEDQNRWRPLLIIAILLSTTLSVLLGLIFWINKRLQREVDSRTAEVLKISDMLEQKDAQKWHIINNISNAIVVFGVEGEVIIYNQMSLELLDPALSIGLHWSQIELCRHIGINLFETTVSDHNEIMGNMVFLNHQHQTKHLQYVLTPVAYKDSGGVELILMVKDTTQEKILYDILHQNDKLSTIGKMSASIAHELRNPLNAMKMYVDLMPNKLENPNFINQALKVLPSEIKRLNEIIDGLLDYTKFTESKKEIISLKDLVDDLATLMKVDLMYKRVQLTTDLEQAVIFVDPRQLKQVLLNLTLNALDAVGEGGKIHIASYLVNDCVMIEVKDNGSGISPEHLDLIFEPNFTTKRTGYGIGLAISKQLIEENEGRIWVESQLGEGTKIFIEFKKVKSCETL